MQLFYSENAGFIYMKVITTERKNSHIEFFKQKDSILDIQTSTRFWRTSRILSADIITEDSGIARCTRFQAEKEADEYDILIELSSLIRKAGHIYTFNGKSFDLPHLKKKYAAYRLRNPLEGPALTDLLQVLRDYNPFLDIPSHRLKDYYALTGHGSFPDSEAWAAYEILPLLSLKNLPEGNFEVREIRADDAQDAVCFVLDCDLPCRICARTAYYEIEGDPEGTKITVKLDQGNLRMYHKDHNNYVYLPIEGYAVHKTLASFVAPSRKIPADRENCYTYIPFNAKFADNPEKVKKYLISVIRFIANT